MSTASNTFDYEEFISRNIGFVTPEEQEKIKNAKVFVCGVGGMGGACVQSLVRAGINTLGIADFDEFELSNLNRQVFSNLQTVGVSKTGATQTAIENINPELKLQVFGKEWINELDTILQTYKIVVNGMDDVRAGVHLYRKCKEYDAVVIDAYTSSLPSITLVRPNDPRPEDRLGYPSRGRNWEDLTESDTEKCVLKEMEHILIHSSTEKHIHIDYAIEMLKGERKRMSFAPMVILTGTLMAYEVTKYILDDSETTNFLGFFFNPFALRVEKPKNAFITIIRKFFVRRYLKSVLDGV